MVSVNVPEDFYIFFDLIFDLSEEVGQTLDGGSGNDLETER